jgi:hypothetical protein
MSLQKLKPYILALDKDEQNSYGYRAKAAYEMLGNVDTMIEAYLKDQVHNKGETLLDVFGLLQGFFVGIDGLYDLAIGLTHYKYHININQNKILHQLKYIRNDIVGHPTNRTYQQGSIGFSMLVPHSLTRETMTYETYIYRKNKLDVRKEVVVFKDMIEAYKTEKEQLVNDIYEFVRQSPLNGQLLNDLLDLYDTLNLDLVENIKVYFMSKYGLDENSKHRFLWRLSLLKTLILWHEDDEDLNGFITYMSKLQVEKLYDIICHMQDVSGKKMYTSIPYVLSDFYKFMRKKEDDALILLNNIHDFDHPLHAHDFDKLLRLEPKGGALKILEFLKAQNDEEKVYLIGSALKKYRPKNNSKK